MYVWSSSPPPNVSLKVYCSGDALLLPIGIVVPSAGIACLNRLSHSAGRVHTIRADEINVRLFGCWRPLKFDFVAFSYWSKRGSYSAWWRRRAQGWKDPGLRVRATRHLTSLSVLWAKKLDKIGKRNSNIAEQWSSSSNGHFIDSLLFAQTFARHASHVHKFHSASMVLSDP